MEKTILDEANQIWNKATKNKAPGDLLLEMEIYKKLLNIFQVGDYYYFIFNVPQMRIEYASESISSVIGCRSEDYTIDYVLDNIHPDDLPRFLDFEATVVEFFLQLPPEKTMKYKSRYDYRIRKTDGDYIHILQQGVAIQSDGDGVVLRAFVVHTDISHLKKNNKTVLSFIGLEGEPSYLDVKSIKRIRPTKEPLTNREKQILIFLAKNKTSLEIGEMLFISKNTVDRHRKNMLAKTETGTTLQLVMKALEKGWI
ncbi:MAG TPA: LuxR C-terminal-related transcriptional regulator [Flavobacteriaceae bacterium]|nr:LuxR C-terminal-related transcriptional regulator [Flavobacteriaceae bacterium]